MHRNIIIVFLALVSLVSCDRPEKTEKVVKVCPPEIAATIKPTFEDQQAIYMDRRSMEPLELFTVNGHHLKIPRQYLVDSIRRDECGRVWHFALSLYWTGSEFEPYRHNPKNDPVNKKFSLGKVRVSWWPKMPGSEPPSPNFYKGRADVYPDWYHHPPEIIVRDKILGYGYPKNKSRSSHFELVGIRDPAGGL